MADQQEQIVVDLNRLHARIDNVTKDFNEHCDIIVNKITEIHTEVKLIAQVCKSRGEVVTHLEKTIRGNSNPGLTSRVELLENTSNSKEKFGYLVIGCLGTGLVSLLIALIINLFN